VSRRALAAAVTVALAVVPGAAGGGSTRQQDVLVTAARLFDGRSFHEPGAVLVRAGKVAAVGSTLDARGARTIALGDATILPGFIDLHVRLGSSAAAPPSSRSPSTRPAARRCSRSRRCGRSSRRHTLGGVG